MNSNLLLYVYYDSTEYHTRSASSSYVRTGIYTFTRCLVRTYDKNNKTAVRILPWRPRVCWIAKASPEQVGGTRDALFFFPQSLVIGLPRAKPKRLVLWPSIRNRAKRRGGISFRVQATA